MDSLQVILNPQLPWLMLSVLAGLAALVAGWHRRAYGIGWRLGCFSVVMLALLDPSLVREQRQPLPDVVAVVVDDSPSQQIRNRQTQTQNALQQLSQQLAAFDQLEVRQLRVGSGMHATRLFTPLREQLADVPAERRAGVILITDGQIHDLPARFDSGEFGPIHVFLTGERNEFDRHLRVVQAPSYGLVNQSITVDLQIVEQPVVEPSDQPLTRPAQLTIQQSGQPTRTIEMSENISLNMPLEHGGINVLQATLEPLPGELDVVNNQVAVMVNALRVPLQVLLLSGRPHAGGRVWRALLKSDPNIDLIHMTILREVPQNDTPLNELSLIQLPVDELFNQRLHDFDLLIFDRYLSRGYISQSYLEKIANYVREGGALLESGYIDQGDARDQTYQSIIGQIMPGRLTGRIIEQAFIPTVSERGRRHPVMDGLQSQSASRTPQEQPWGRWFRQSEVEAQRGEIIMTGALGSPLVLLDRVENGRVAQLTSNDIWLWRRGLEGGGPASELLRRIVHWLMKEPALEESGLSAYFEGNQLVIDRRFLDSPPPSVELTTPSGERQYLPLVEQRDGLVSARWQASETGLYQVQDDNGTALAVLARATQAEFANLLTTEQVIAPVVEDSDGGLFWLADRPSLPYLRRTRLQQTHRGSDWIGLRNSNSFKLTGRSSTSLIPEAMLLALGLGLLLAGWARESQIAQHRNEIKR